MRISFYKHGKKHTFKVHRLVGQAFIPNPQNLPQINHKDENKKNNKADNLEWCDNSYNQNYGTRNDRASNSNRNKESESVPVICVETNIIYPSIREARRQTGIYNIESCCLRKRNTAGGYHWQYATNIRRMKNVMQEVEEGAKVKIGDKVFLPTERNGYVVMARDERYIICVKKIAGNPLYFIVDLKEKWRAPDDRVFCSGYTDSIHCEERLKELQQGIIGLSKRRGIPLDIDIK